MYTQEEVERLLETQRGNCYVSVLGKCGDEEIASACIKAPEPGGDQWKKSKKETREEFFKRFDEAWDNKEMWGGEYGEGI